MHLLELWGEFKRMHSQNIKYFTQASSLGQHLHSEYGTSDYKCHRVLLQLLGDHRRGIRNLSWHHHLWSALTTA